MPNITNVSQEAVRVGDHPPAQILIQITDPDRRFVTPENHFPEIHQYKFADADTGEVPQEQLFTATQARSIVQVLQQAHKQDKDIVVHCVAGVCRSGAVVEVAEMMGFTPEHSNRIPNRLVKYTLMKQLGWTYD